MTETRCGTDCLTEMVIADVCNESAESRGLGLGPQVGRLVTYVPKAPTNAIAQNSGESMNGMDLKQLAKPT